MRYAVTVAALALALAVSACATGAKQQEFTRADAEAIRRNASELAQALNGKQMDKIIDFYADNSVFMPPNAPLLRGRDPLKSFFSNMLERGATIQLQPEDVAGHGPIAYDSGTYSLTYEKTNSRDRGKYLRILRNTNGTWRTEKMIWSSDLPPVAGSAD